MARTAFVTGGSGFLGRHVVEQLANQGWRVVALHRPTSDVRALRTYAGVELAEGSITDPASLERAIPEGCDAVFHVAGNTSLWSGGNAQQTRENVDGTRFVVETCLKRKVGRLVHTSSVASWGEQHVVPFDETAPQHAAGSFVNYERTKYLGELEVLKGVERGLPACIMNPGHIVGRYDANSWARLIRLVDAQKLPGIPPGEGTWAAATEVAKAPAAPVKGLGIAGGAKRPGAKKAAAPTQSAPAAQPEAKSEPAAAPEAKAPAAPAKGLGIAAGAKRPGAKKAAPAAQPAAPKPEPEATPEPQSQDAPESTSTPEDKDGETKAPAAPVKGLGIARGARPPGKR